MTASGLPAALMRPAISTSGSEAAPAGFDLVERAEMAESMEEFRGAPGDGPLAAAPDPAMVEPCGLGEPVDG
jgi:hypothetical protein